MLVPDDVPDEPNQLEAMLYFEARSLDLTEHRKHMFDPIEARMCNILVPSSIASKAANHRKWDRNNLRFADGSCLVASPETPNTTTR